MEIRLYNTLVRKKEVFQPIKPNQVGIYSCGPTVYWNQHIGHMYAYIQWDVLVRLFRYLDFKVKWVMNITDVGHLTSDEDTGEDKMEVGAKREKLTVWQIADKYTKQFLDSLDSLNIQRPDTLCRATKHINEQIELIKLIEKNGFTYKTKTGLVFDTSKFPDYSAFARSDLKGLKPGVRVEIDPEKKNPWDFLLWVTNQPKHIMQWDSPWGRGFPGWHIECTAMSVKYLGERFDIHTGGKEHISIHHTNEIAQAFGAFGHQTVNFWLHNDWLVLKNEKMSKSKGNMYLMTDLIKKGFDPLAFRYLVLTSHYRKGLNFSFSSLKSASRAYLKLKSSVRGLKQDRQENTVMTQESESKTQKYRKKFLAAITDDLSVPEALAVVWELVKSSVSAYDKYDLLLEFDEILGLNLKTTATSAVGSVPKEVLLLVEKRNQLRQEKKWSRADQIRKKIERLGWQVEDTASGPQAKRLVN